MSIDRSTPFRHFVDASGDGTMLNTNFAWGLLRRLWPRLESVIDTLLSPVTNTKDVTRRKDSPSSPPTYALRSCTCYLRWY